MKTLIVLMSLLAASIFAKAQNDYVNYVITKTDTLICDNYRIGAFQFKGKLVSGEKFSVPYGEVTMYGRSGKVMKKLPVFVDGKKTKCCDFMELVDNKNGLAIYKYEKRNCDDDCLDAIFSYYKQGAYVYSQRNPGLKDIKDFVLNYKHEDQQLITAE